MHTYLLGPFTSTAPLNQNINTPIPLPKGPAWTNAAGFGVPPYIDSFKAYYVNNVAYIAMLNATAPSGADRTNWMTCAFLEGVCSNFRKFRFLEFDF